MGLAVTNGSAFSYLSTYAARENLSDNLTTSGEVDVRLPSALTFSDDSVFSIVAYSLMFLVAAVGNLVVFVVLFRSRRRRSRVNLYVMHLAVADLIVTFVMIPIEVSWHATVLWATGDLTCRFFMFWRTFGFYLSSLVLIVISVDRYFAIVHPMSFSDAERRGKMMLRMAWIVSTVVSIPQVRYRMGELKLLLSSLS
ncbi:Gonadotropin-releasing hormone receptor [Lamellibrachia satsuma]|nr:Gonadotropin-releasing hormone receptor [Lamellibrachia satsuma]